MRRGVMVVALLSTGCGSASLLLKTPAESQCVEAGLKGCPQMAEGLVAYVEGDQARGQRLLSEGAAENAPDDLRKFADIVVLLGNIPGAKQYAGPVFAVAEVLRSKAAEAPSASAGSKRDGERGGRAGGDGGRAGNGGERGASARAAADASGAGPIPMRTRQAGHVTMLAVPQKFPCADGAEAGSCMRTAIGPLVVTDVSLSPECAGGATVLAVPLGESPSRARAKWALHTATSAGAWPVTESDVLVVRVAGESRERCSVSWAGFVPEGDPY